MDSELHRRLMLDLIRTFNDQRLKEHSYLISDIPESSAQFHQRVYNVLKAFNKFSNKVVPYEQGMSFIAGTLVLISGEEDSFWLFVQMMKKYYVAGMYQKGCPVLEKCIQHFKEMVLHLFPDLHKHFETEGISVEVFANQWFLTLFSYNFPLTFVVHVWDLFWIEGLDIVLTLALAILKIFREQLLNCKYLEIMKLLSSMYQLIDPDALVQSATDMLRV